MGSKWHLNGRFLLKTTHKPYVSVNLCHSRAKMGSACGGYSGSPFPWSGKPALLARLFAATQLRGRYAASPRCG